MKYVAISAALLVFVVVKSWPANHLLLLEEVPKHLDDGHRAEVF